MARYEYAPAALSGKQTVHWDQDGLRIDKDGSSKILRWVDLGSARYWTSRVKTVDFYGFELKDSAGESYSLSMTVPAGTGADNPFRAGYYGMLREICAVLKTARPDVKVDYGQPKTYAWIYFGTGVIAFLFAAVMGFLLLTEVPDRMGAAAPPVVILLLFGAYLAWSFRPGRPTVQFSLDEMAAMSERYANPDQR
ncbi:hypothetical protein [Ponticaulis sp.]|uniref:hypothetical protein n=1 Tax=Ponticaulis sp. TaxID=2020902 RepID=UPI00262D7DDB|nr:hypothetical protein [Ponticaulis sp.]MDF1679097.1 hypothetical protein [Ponticaulis sp.]